MHQLIHLLVALAVLAFMACRIEISWSHCPSPRILSLSFRRLVLNDMALQENVDDIIVVPLLHGVHIHRKLRPFRSTHW